MSRAITDPAVTARLREVKEHWQHQADNELRIVMETEEGRRVVYRLIDQETGLFSGSFVPDSHQTSFNEGRRSVGIRLLGEVQRVAKANYVRMLSEAFSRQAERERLVESFVSTEDERERRNQDD